MPEERETKIILDDEDEEIRTYISAMTDGPVELPLADSLHSGVVLCEMANKIISKNRKNENKKTKNLKTINYSDSKSPFIQRENIAQFIEFAKNFVKPYEMFETEDLYGKRNLQQVKITLYALSRGLKFYGLTETCIGPEQHTNHEIKREPKVFRNSGPVYTFYEKNAQNDTKFSGRRQITLEMMEVQYRPAKNTSDSQPSKKEASDSDLNSKENETNQ